MIICKTIDSALQAHMPWNIRRCVIKEILRYVEINKNYDPSEDGYVVALLSSPNHFMIKQIFGKNWDDICWEAVTYDKTNNCYIALYLFNNQFSITLVLDANHPASYLKCIQEQVIREIY